MLLRMGLLLRLGPNVITDRTFIIYAWAQNVYGWDFYYAWVQMLLLIGPLLRLGSKCYYGWDFYYINTNEIPGELSRENLISSHVKITCYLHV